MATNNNNNKKQQITITMILLITCLAAKEIRETLDIIADILKIRYYLNL